MERAMRTWGSTVYRLALNQTQSPHDAEDICQDVFLRLLKDATAFKDDEHLKAWLLCVAINRCRDLHRSAWKRRAELTDAVPDAGREDPRSDDAARALQDSELGRALGRLPDKMRLIVHLHYYEGFSTEEIARLVHCRARYGSLAPEPGSNATREDAGERGHPLKRTGQSPEQDQYRALMDDIEMPGRVHDRVMREAHRLRTAEAVHAKPTRRPRTCNQSGYRTRRFVTAVIAAACVLALASGVAFAISQQLDNATAKNSFALDAGTDDFGYGGFTKVWRSDPEIDPNNADNAPDSGQRYLSVAHLFDLV